MNTLVNKFLATEIHFSEHSFKVVITDGRALEIPLAYFPRLLHATPEQRNQFVISGGGSGLHWEELNEDIMVENLFYGFGDTTKHSPRSTKAA